MPLPRKTIFGAALRLGPHNALHTTKTVAGFDVDAELGLAALARGAACSGRLATVNAY
jgi:hypothetical protein